MKKTTLSAAAFVAVGALALAGCSSADGDSEPTTSASDAAPVAEDITLWLAGTDTPDTLIDYLKTEYTAVNGGALTVEQIGWGDLISSLTTALPDSENTPDVFEVGNTQAATFTTVGAFADLTDHYEDLGGDSLLPGFVEAGSIGDQIYALPYYFGSRAVFYRQDIYEAAGVEVPTTLAEYTEVNKAMYDEGVGGAYLAGRDWRSGISWIFANGGDIATFDGSTWTASLSSPESLAGMEQWQELFETANVAQPTDDDTTTYSAINDEFLAGTPASSTMAPSWATWTLGDYDEESESYVWNPETFGVYALPGVDGGTAPVFAGGSNIGISAASTHQDGAMDLMEILFSDEYQTMLAENGMGPANLDFADIYAENSYFPGVNAIALEAASNAKLTPAAAGWASIEEAGIMEDYFQAVAEGGDVATLAAEADAKINELING
ncbi:extracellular solute-binding protein [Demequina zhanjiangensis]|uniref:Extracellular solute-binding protein n=1 Tax=Demequina zhanjiangensis TaxID=3051659 RepID=A0ABT8FXI3_9MICO|nr:extracellular solute-binding protein [Demequina sp. SYSU T00b26]MDN4471608.1 extracellular solute-binding protein [Demequina sp. SYSU T00b26]